MKIFVISWLSLLGLILMLLVVLGSIYGPHNAGMTMDGPWVAHHTGMTLTILSILFWIVLLSPLVIGSIYEIFHRK